MLVVSTIILQFSVIQHKNVIPMSANKTTKIIETPRNDLILIVSVELSKSYTSGPDSRITFM